MAFKYTTWLPVYASAKFELVVEEEIPETELKSRFLAEAEPVNSLCWQCANHTETDHCVADEIVGDLTFKKSKVDDD